MTVPGTGGYRPAVRKTVSDGHFMAVVKSNGPTDFSVPSQRNDQGDPTFHPQTSLCRRGTRPLQLFMRDCSCGRERGWFSNHETGRFFPEVLHARVFLYVSHLPTLTGVTLEIHVTLLVFLFRNLGTD